MKKYKFLIAIIAFAVNHVNGQCACCAGAATGSSGSLNNNNNGMFTIPKKQLVVEDYSEYRTINIKSQHHEESGKDEEDEETPLKSIFVNSLGARYGITDRITVSASIPYVFLHTNSGNDNGLGDLMVMGTFNVYSRQGINLALQGGVELPTGIQKGSNFDNTTVVVGSGSYDPLIGLLFSKQWENNIAIQGNGFFKYTTNGFRGNYYGNISVHNLSVSYKIKEQTKEVSNASADSQYEVVKVNYRWTIFGGYYGEWLDKIREENVVDEDSGYYLGFTNLGANFNYGKWSFPVMLSTPVVQAVNGNQNDAGIRLKVGLIRSF